MDEIGLLNQAAEEFAGIGRLEAARAVARPDGEQQALAREATPVGLAQ